MSGGWAGSERLSRLPANWPQLRERIRKRDGYRCTWIHGNPDGLPRSAADLDGPHRCTGPAAEVDHINRHAGDDEDNLRSLCTPHHAAKSAAEGVEARRAIAAQRYRPREQHPGLLR